MLSRTLLISASALALAAGSSVDLSEPDNAGHILSICNADKVSHITGQALSARVEQEALHSSGAGMLRVIRPGQAVTRDYRSERLNLQLNDHGVVVRAYCG